MTTDTNTYTEPAPELIHRDIAAGPARVAVMRRTYETSVADLWDACTNPARLARWYTIIEGDLRVGGEFTQEMMGSGRVEECEAPGFLRVSLGGGVDEIEVRITPGDVDGTADIEIQHATTLLEHEIGGETYDAIFCMGGGYYPRLLALDMHLRGTLADDYASTTFHTLELFRPAIERGSAAMDELVQRDRQN